MPTPNPDPRRERIATAALAGLLAGRCNVYEYSENAELAVRAADALIAELDREQAKRAAERETEGA